LRKYHTVHYVIWRLTIVFRWIYSLLAFSCHVTSVIQRNCRMKMQNNFTLVLVLGIDFTANFNDNTTYLHRIFKSEYINDNASKSSSLIHILIIHMLIVFLGIEIAWSKQIEQLLLGCDQRNDLPRL